MWVAYKQSKHGISWFWIFKKKLVVQLEEAEGEKLIEKLSWASET